MNGEAAPAASDLQHHVVGADLHLLAEALPLAALGLFKREVRLVVVGRRIGHRGVEPEFEEIVPEIVVLADVVAALGLAVGPERVSDPVEGPQQVEKPVPLVIPCPNAGEVVAVEDEPGEGAGQVVSLPFSCEIGLSKADGPEENTAAVEVLVADCQFRMQFLPQSAKEAT